MRDVGHSTEQIVVDGETSFADELAELVVAVAVGVNDAQDVDHQWHSDRLSMYLLDCL